MNRDRPGRTNEFAHLTGDAPLSPMFVRHQSWRTAIVRWQMLIPFFLRVLHRDFLFAGKNIHEVSDGDSKTGKDCWQISLFCKGQFWSGYGIRHGSSSLISHERQNDRDNEDVHQGDFDEEIPA